MYRSGSLRPPRAQSSSAYPSPAWSDPGCHEDQSQFFSLTPRPTVRSRPRGTSSVYPISALSMEQRRLVCSEDWKHSLVASGLHLDIGIPEHEHLSSNVPFNGYGRQAQPTTVSLYELQNSETAGIVNPSNSSSISSCQNSDSFSYGETRVLHTPEFFCREPTLAYRGVNSGWSATDDAVYEPCHLAISSDESTRFTEVPAGHYPSDPAALSWPGSPEAGEASGDAQVKAEEDYGEQITGIHDETDTAEGDFLDDFKPDSSEHFQLSAGPSELQRHSCFICHKTFERMFNLKTHMHTHEENRERNFRCNKHGCDKAFFRLTDLKRHDKSVHAKSKEFRCDECGSGFPRKDSLKRHIADGCALRPKVKRKPQRKSRRSLSVRSASPVTHPRRRASSEDYMENEQALRIMRASEGALSRRPED